MTMTKRLLAGVMLLVMAFSLFGCAQQGEGEASSSGADVPKTSGEGLQQDADKPTPNVNLITGEALKEGQTPGKRPAAIMVSNIAQALPQRGIGSADAVLEMETEGGITRLMAFFADPASVPNTGPVRSARDQHLQFALPLNAVLVHIGTSIYAKNLLNEYAYQDINGLYLGTTSFALDEERRKTRNQEHCWYTDAALISAGMTQNGIVPDGSKNTLLNFAAPGKTVTLNGGDAPHVRFLASNTTEVQMVYDAASGTYLKTEYSNPIVDEATGAQLSYKNVFVLFAKVTLKPDGNCTDFALTSGTGYYFCGGKYQKIQWKKGDVTEPLQILDENGKEFNVNTGKSYIAVVRRELEKELKPDINAAAPAASSVSAPAA